MHKNADNNSWTGADLLNDSCIRMETSNSTVERKDWGYRIYEDWGYRVYDQQDDVETHLYFLDAFRAS